MKKLIGILVVVMSVIVVGQTSFKGEVASSCNEQNFASVAAEQAYAAHGDMSVVVADDQVVSSVKLGTERETYAASFSCSSGCTANCTRSCSTCCSHQCGRGY